MTYKANEPYVLVSADSQTLHMEPLYDLIKGDTTYETIPDVVYEYGSSDIIALSAGFEVNVPWADGEVKQFYMRGLTNPIKLRGNNSFSGVTVNEVPGKIMFALEDDASVVWSGLNSYLDNHVVSDEHSISSMMRAYTLVIEILRKGTDAYIREVKYTIPYFTNDEVAGIYSQGEFTFRSIGSVYPGGISDSSSRVTELMKYSGVQFQANDLKKVNITIGTDWIPLSGLGSCSNWIDMFVPHVENDKFYLSIKPYEISTVA